MTELASEYLEGQMSWSMRLKFKLHLFMCVQCRRYLRQFKQMLNMINLVVLDDPAEDDEIKLILEKLKQARNEHKHQSKAPE